MENWVKTHSRNLNAKVLLIADEIEAARVWAFSLNQAGLEVTLVPISEPGLEVWAKELPDLIVLADFDEQIEELALCRSLRDVTDVPLIFLTCKTGETFNLEAYRAGADECISFPITPRLFQAKVHAWLRRSRSIPLAALDEIRVGCFALNADQKRLTLPTNETVRLTVLESRALFLFMSHPGCLFNSEEVIEKVWGYYGDADSKLLKNLVYRLRKKIEPDPNQPRYLLNERSNGYRFCAK